MGSPGDTSVPSIPADPGDTADAAFVSAPGNVSGVANAVTITYSDSGVTIDNPLAGSGVTVTENGGHVEVQAGSVTDVNYILTGVISDGSFKIYGNENFGLYYQSDRGHLC